jgi:hypothetical protein
MRNVRAVEPYAITSASNDPQTLQGAKHRNLALLIDFARPIDVSEDFGRRQDGGRSALEELKQLRFDTAGPRLMTEIRFCGT